MTTNEIKEVIIQDLNHKGFPIFLTSFAGRGFAEADIFAINGRGIIYEFEVKRSRADFLADFRNKKNKHRKLSKRRAIYEYQIWKHGKRTDEIETLIQIPNRFFFVCEKNLLHVEDIPEYAGLIVIDKYLNPIELKQAPLLHKYKANQILYQRVAQVLSQRIIFGCSYYTYQHRKKQQFLSNPKSNF